MKIDEDNFTCPIHYGILIEPYECVSCKNNFCKKCIIDYIKKQDKCPLCSTSPFNYNENISLKRILNDIKFICQKCGQCGQSFKNEDEYNSHTEICIIFKYVCTYGVNNNPNYARIYPNSVTKNQDIKYCYKENKTIPCSCCTEHICQPGSCLCKKCMFLNIK